MLKLWTDVHGTENDFDVLLYALINVYSFYSYFFYYCSLDIRVDDSLLVI